MTDKEELLVGIDAFSIRQLRGFARLVMRTPEEADGNDRMLSAMVLEYVDAPGSRAPLSDLVVAQVSDKRGVNGLVTGYSMSVSLVSVPPEHIHTKGLLELSWWRGGGVHSEGSVWGCRRYPEGIRRIAA